MPYTNLNTILSWFETGDYPTQTQFAHSWSSFWHKGELIPLNQIQNIDVFMQQTTPIESFNAHLNEENAHSLFLATKDASNLSLDNILSWKEALEVGQLPDNIATIDTDMEVGNAYKKVVPPDFDRVYALGISGFPVPIAETGLEDIVSEDNSLLIEPDTNNIESNISIFSEEFANHPTSLVSISFEPIQILGVYDGGLKLNTNEYEQQTPTRINLTGVRKYTLIPELQNMIEVQYTHLKTDI